MAKIHLKIVLIFQLLLSLLSHSASLPTEQISECPGYEEHPVLLVSLDGFRPDYLNRGITPTIQKLIDEGVSAPHMKPSYPTVTFPNHYTITTGLYPESHGIIANSFYDSELKDSFWAGELANGKWFSGEPIWNTVVKNGKKSAAYFWIGSEAEIDGLRPTYFYPYDGSVPYEDRVEQVLLWLAMPPEDRPSWISVYFEEPDKTAHEFGPNSQQVDGKLVKVDETVLSLLNGISDLGLTNCVNIIIVSDHGMSPAGFERIVNLEEYEPNLDEKTYYYEGANSRMKMKDEYIDEQIPLMEKFSCETEILRQFDKMSLPKRYHFSNNKRIEDIILDLNTGHTAGFESDFFLEGAHGYDNEYEDMLTVFLATGPDLKKETSILPFQNIELYNLMCDLLSIKSASNNGTTGSLYKVMNNPPPYPELDLGQHPEVSKFPNDEEILERLDASECSGDLQAPEDWIDTLAFDEKQQDYLNSIHIPFGAPTYRESLSSNVQLLHHNGHIIGYSPSLKMPVWTSFTFNNIPTGSQQTLWSSDVRLLPEDTAKCSDYQRLQDYIMSPLFRPEYSHNASLDRIPFMISNAIPMTTEMETRYNELINDIIPSWQLIHGGPLNIIAGPVFDNDFDSLVDNIIGITSLKAPSDVFVIVTKCASENKDNLKDCEIDELQVISFIYRQTQTVSNCLTKKRFAEEFTARVKDIELSTGLIFFADLGSKNAIDLITRSKLGDW